MNDPCLSGGCLGSTHPDRGAKSLGGLIDAAVAPTIITDDWSSYADLTQCNYLHTAPPELCDYCNP